MARVELAGDNGYVAVLHGRTALHRVATADERVELTLGDGIEAFAFAGEALWLVDDGCLRRAGAGGAGVALGGAGRLLSGEGDALFWSGAPALRVVDGVIEALALPRDERLLDVSGATLLSARAHELWLRHLDGSVLHRVELQDDEEVLEARLTSARYPLLVLSRVGAQCFLSVLNERAQRLSRVAVPAVRRLRVSDKRQFAFLFVEGQELIAFDLRYGRRVAAATLPQNIADFAIDAVASVFVLVRHGEEADAPCIQVMTYRELFSERGLQQLHAEDEPEPEPGIATVAKLPPPPLLRPLPRREVAPPPPPPSPSLRDPFGVIASAAPASPPRPTPRPARRRTPIPGAPPPKILTTHRFALVERARAMLLLLAPHDDATGARLRADLAAASAHLADLERRFTLPINQVCDSLALDRVDRETLALACAPHLDDSVRDAVRHLRADRARGWVDAALAFELACPSRVERVAAARRLGPEWALVDAGLVELVPPRSLPHHPSLLEHELVPSERLLGVLEGAMVLGAGVAELAELRLSRDDDAAGILDAVETAKAIALARAAFAAAAGAACVVLVGGPSGVGKSRLASALAAATGHRGVLVVDAVRLPRATPQLAETLRLLGREATIANTALLIHGLDPAESELPLWQALLARAAGLVLITTTRPAKLRPAATLALEVPRPAAEVRVEAWRRALARREVSVAPEQLETLARTYALGPARLEQALGLAEALARDHGVAPTLAAIETCARTQLAGEISQYAEHKRSRRRLDDLVLCEDTREVIVELIDAVRARPRVMAAWDFERKLECGRGICALFNGPPGTGKTFAAGVIANELDMPLYRINVSTIVDRYVGETEKNLSRLFAEAADQHAVLLFDEADSLFARRVSAKDATDRYANMQVNLLLNLIEDHEGFCILTTNMKSGLDTAFLRRIAFKLTFFAPEAEEREALWRGHAPARVPLADDVDFAALAREYKVSGGEIKNAVLRAALRAWSRPPITNAMLHEAMQAELTAAGSVVVAAAAAG